jgi:hypothetical protein
MTTDPGPVPGADKLGGDESGEQTGSDLGPGAPPEHPPVPEPDEPFQSPLSVAGIGPGGEPYGGRSPSEENPAADPNDGS